MILQEKVSEGKVMPPFEFIPEFLLPLVKLFIIVVTLGFFAWVLYEFVLKLIFEALKGEGDRSKPKPPKFRVRTGSMVRQALRNKVIRKVRTFVFRKTGVDIGDWIQRDSDKFRQLFPTCHRVGWCESDPTKVYSIKDFCSYHNRSADEKMTVQSFLSDLLAHCEKELEMGSLPRQVAPVKEDYMIVEVIEFVVDFIETKKR